MILNKILIWWFQFDVTTKAPAAPRKSQDNNWRSGDFKEIQNKLLRCLNGTKIKKKVSTKSLLKKFEMCSDNQLNAQVKLIEIWKGLNIADYPPKIEQQKTNPNSYTRVN